MGGSLQQAQLLAEALGQASWRRRLRDQGLDDKEEAKDNGKCVKTAWGQHARQGQHCKVTEMRGRMVYLGWW